MASSPSDEQRRHQTLTLSSIERIDRGRVALAFNHALRRATLDVMDRPADDAAREVQLLVKLTPNRDKDMGALDTVGVEFIVKDKAPPRRSAGYSTLPTDDGRQLFQPDSPFDPRQASFEFADSPHPPHTSHEQKEK